MSNITGRLGSLVGFVLVAGFLGLILYKTRELPLILICAGVMAMALWHAVEEEWRGSGK